MLMLHWHLTQTYTEMPKLGERQDFSMSVGHLPCCLVDSPRRLAILKYCEFLASYSYSRSLEHHHDEAALRTELKHL